MMGYSTEFSGVINIEPPLNEYEAAFLRDFSGSRRMGREEGPYFADPGNDFGQGRTPGIRDFNTPPAEQPGLWCQWVPTPDGSGLEWNGAEKFYDAAEWMKYLIDHFLKPGAVASEDLKDSVQQDPRFADFTFDHVLDGVIEAQGEDADDRWNLIVYANEVSTQEAVVSFGELVPVK